MARKSGEFSAEERAAMKQRAAELRAEAKAAKGAQKKAVELQACLDAIAGLTGLDREVAERYHAIVVEEAPQLDPKTWYGFPSYARDGKVVTFVQPMAKFGTRYPTIGFQEDARLDDGPMWATSYAVVSVDGEVEERLRALVRKAAG